MIPKFAYIYGLYDPRNSNEIVYVGKTNNHYNRLGYYKKDAYKYSSPVNLWIRSLLEKGISPCIKVLERCKFKNWKIRERRLISIWRKINSNLLNILDGGNGTGVKGVKQFCDRCGTKRTRIFVKDTSLRCPVCRPLQKMSQEKKWKDANKFRISVYNKLYYSGAL
jgi:hypothetical protein